MPRRAFEWDNPMGTAPLALMVTKARCLPSVVETTRSRRPSGRGQFKAPVQGFRSVVAGAQLDCK